METGSSPHPISEDTDTSIRKPGRKRRLVRVLVIGTVLMLAAAWTLAWQFIALSTEASLTAWKDGRRAAGETLSHQRMTLDGYPFWVRYTLPEARWRSGADRIEVNAERLVVASRLWSPFTLLVTAPDGVTGTMETGPGRDTLSFASQGGRAVLEIGETTIRSGTVALTSATVTRLAAPDAPVADIGSVEVMLEPKKDSSAGPAQTVAVSASDLRLSEAIRVPFEGPASLSARATMSGPFAGLHPDQIAIWREAGGVLDVHRLDLNWSPLNLRADGTFGLDSEYRPEGASTISAAGLPETVERVVALGGIRPRNAALLSLGLQALSKTPPEGGPPRVEAPLTVQNGRIYLGPVQIGRIGSVLR